MSYTYTLSAAGERVYSPFCYNSYELKGSGTLVKVFLKDKMLKQHKAPSEKEGHLWAQSYIKGIKHGNA